jgi:hypothetical protein
LCEWLLTGTQKAGGTPQRILWAPVQYPDMPRPEDLPFWPGEHKLPKWPLPQRKSKGQGGRNGQTIFTPSITNDDVSTAITEAELKAHELDLPPEVETMVRESRHRYHHGEMDELSGHGMLTRLKVAVGLMWLDGRTDKISSEDWELSGIVMAISDRTRLGIQRILDARGKQKERARGRSEAHREVAKAAQMAGERRKDLDRVKARIIARLAAAPGMTLAGGDLTRVMRSVPRELRDEAMAELADEGRVDIRERVYQGQTGYKYTLLDGS